MSETIIIRLQYCAIITIAFILAGIGGNYRNRQKHILVYFLILLLAILIGSRPVVPHSDSAMYNGWFNRICKDGWAIVNDKFNGFGNDPLFSLLFLLTAPFKSFRFTMTLVSFLSLFLTYRVCRLYTLTEEKGSSLLLFFCTIINFTFLNQQDNVIRIGIAFPLLLFYLYYLFRKEYSKALIYGAIAVGIHFSMAAAIAISFIARYLRCQLKWYYILFFVILIASAAGVSIQGLVGYFTFYKAEIYSQLNESGGYKVGFRPDFAAFNVAFLLFFAYLNKRRSSDFMSFYIRLYILFSCWFFLWFKVPYNDRVGAYSWNLIPIISYFGCIDKFPKKKTIWGSYLFGALLLMNLVIFIHIFKYF